MTGRIERLSRQLSARVALPMLVLAIGVPTRPDPIAKRLPGTAGVIAIPGAGASATPSGARGDLVPLEARRDARAARGRVLYGPGHAPRDASPRPAAKQPCPVQRVVQLRPGLAAPTS